MKVESGAVDKPSVQTMAKTAKALGVSIEELLKWTNQYEKTQ
jgi:hypothetical protein